MNVTVHHSLPGRLRLHYDAGLFYPRQAILAQSLIAVQEGITDIDLNTATGSFLIHYDTKVISEKQILALFKALTSKYLEDEELLEKVAQVPERESIGGVFVSTFIIYFAKKLLPLPVRTLLLYKDLVPRILKALSHIAGGKIFTTDLLDAAALTFATATGNRNTATQISTLLGMGEQIEEITRRQSYNNLAKTLLISHENVCLIDGDEEKQVPASALKKGDLIVVRKDSLIPADGTVEKGMALVNQASITGESLPVEKNPGSSVFAGTVLSEGEIYIRVRTTGTGTKVQNIIRMIDDSQNLKAAAQKRSEMIAEKIVPFNFLLAAVTWIITRNITRTMSTLMVDYSCAMKLSAPIAVLSAMKEAAERGISVKGGKYLEEAANADTVVFDKTGTLTTATPALEEIYPLKGLTKDEVLTYAACLEEHYPHPLGRAVVKAAEEKGLVHPEEHAKVEYIVAHGIASTWRNKKIRIGSAHFIFDDEKVPLTEEAKKIQEKCLNEGHSLLYLAYDGMLAGIIAIGDPSRPEAKETVTRLHSLGIRNCVMITGDTEGAARKIARKAGIDKWISQALPEDKVRYIEKARSNGHHVIMLGDGINDAPALSAADVGIAAEGCSSIAGETADIELNENGLENLVTVRRLGMGLIDKINTQNIAIIALNSLLLGLGVFSLITPSLAAILHNSLTVAISLRSMENILEDIKQK